MAGTAPAFDLEKYTRNSKALPVEDLPWEDVPRHPLTAGEVRFLHYMMNIETHTIVYLKELLSTKAIEDGEVTAFLACWNYEEYFHGAALERFLKAYVGPDAVRNETGYRLRQSSGLSKAVKRLLGPVVSAATPDFAAVHMTWGATQEYTTLVGYESVARQTKHPILRELMHRIVKDERRHFAFYYNQAARRLAKEPRMHRVTRWAMDHLWRPVGVGAMPASESDFSSWLLYRDAETQAALREAQRTMGELPGMAGWDALMRQMDAAIARVDALGPGFAAEAYAHQPPAAAAAAAPARAPAAPLVKAM